MARVTSSLELTFPAGVPGTVLGAGPSLSLEYLGGHVMNKATPLSLGTYVLAGETDRRPYTQPKQLLPVGEADEG